MKLNYWLSIEAKNHLHHAITEILGVESNQSKGDNWLWIVTQNENDQYFDFINVFVDLLTSRKQKLQEFGITFADISIWMIYWHDGQCNMEFDPERMKKIGNAGINLCITCYEEYENTKPELG